jgi:hypothetical protein
MGGSEYVSLVIADAINSFVVVAVVNMFYIVWLVVVISITIDAKYGRYN